MMKTSTRKKIKVERITNVSELGQITNEELMRLSNEYDPENYNLLENIQKKEIVTDNREIIVTMRFTKEENDLITLYAQNNRMSKSSFIRSILLDGISTVPKKLNDQSFITNLKAELTQLNKRIEKIEQKNLQEYKKEHIANSKDSSSKIYIKVKK